MIYNINEVKRMFPIIGERCISTVLAIILLFC